jgi:hypothetical protein
VLILSGFSFVLVLVPIFHVPVQGSLLLFYGVAALYVFAMTSMGSPSPSWRGTCRRRSTTDCRHLIRH